VYQGSFKNNVYDGPGRFVLPAVKIIVFQESEFEEIIGDFSHGFPSFGVQQVVHTNPHTCLKVRFDRQPVWKYFGEFGKRISDDQSIWHGYGAYFIQIENEDGDLKIFKFVGNFLQGKRQGKFRIFETNLDDMLLKHFPKKHILARQTSFQQGTRLDEGTLLGYAHFENNVRVDSVQFNNFWVYKNVLTRMEYVGEGHLDYFEFSDGFFTAHGVGTVFVQGKKRYAATFVHGIPVRFWDLYDEDECLMWKSTEETEPTLNRPLKFLDTQEEWPCVHGKGNVYDSQGKVLYGGQFTHGKLEHLQQIVRSMSVAQHITFEEQPEDYISFQKFRKHMHAMVVNDELCVRRQIMSVKTFFSAMETHLKDPLRGSYPALRFQKIQVEF
jgi:hypothetical protein